MRLLTAEGELLAEVADDQVESATMGEESALRSWREVEVELGSAGDETLLTTIGERLVEWGASRSTSVSKLRRALGPEATPEPEPDLDTLGGVIAARKLFEGARDATNPNTRDDGGSDPRRGVLAKLPSDQ